MTDFVCPETLSSVVVLAGKQPGVHREVPNSVRAETPTGVLVFVAKEPVSKSVRAETPTGVLVFVAKEPVSKSVRPEEARSAVSKGLL